MNQLWVADITYLRLSEQFIYLAVILDAFLSLIHISEPTRPS